MHLSYALIAATWVSFPSIAAQPLGRIARGDGARASVISKVLNETSSYAKNPVLQPAAAEADEPSKRTYNMTRLCAVRIGNSRHAFVIQSPLGVRVCPSRHPAALDHDRIQARSTLAQSVTSAFGGGRSAYTARRWLSSGSCTGLEYRPKAADGFAFWYDVVRRLPVYQSVWELGTSARGHQRTPIPCNMKGC